MIHEIKAIGHIKIGTVTYFATSIFSLCALCVLCGELFLRNFLRLYPGNSAYQHLFYSAGVCLAH